MLDEHNRLMDRWRAMMEKVQNQVAKFEVHATSAAQIKLLKQEKQATEERVEMGIKRIRIILWEAGGEWMRQTLEEVQLPYGGNGQGKQPNSIVRTPRIERKPGTTFIK